ncbi:MAG: hypothetical protein KJO82_04565 [Gammaproteobacteria bacterium]|nr:hypothetical protein [Gammaproteobacteria bacterium]
MNAEATPVELQQTDEGWQLYRDGEPYFIRGAGGSHSMQELAAAGANSIRTWGADDIAALLDEAHTLGLSVTVGIWLGHERHGFDYSDAQQVAEQKERVRQTVLRYKDHPAVLIWGLGNEMEGFADGDNPLIWAAVNDIAKMVKELDPLHPTMTVTAEIGGGRIKAVHETATGIDIHGINSYGGAPSIPERLRAGGPTKPYILTEFGPPGAWEVATTEWGAAYEMTSTEKADYYRHSHEQAIANAPGQSLGGYAFTWGFKMEATATWYGMFLNDGTALGAVDAMSEIWSGKPRDNLAPAIAPLAIDGSASLDPGTELRVRAKVADPEDGPLRVHWVLRQEAGETMTGGDFRPDMPDLDGAVLESDANGALIRMPDEPDAYRLFQYVWDDAGNAAVANIPLQVKGEIRKRFPISVYEDGFAGMRWAPSGWMGNTDALTVDDTHSENPQEGLASLKLRYEGVFNWVGIAWQHPANNWGEQEGGFDLTGASQLQLWARGEYGGEKIKIGVGIIEEDQPYPDSGLASVDGIALSNEWQRYTIDLNNVDLSSIKTGFYVAITGRRTPVTVYLDSIRFVR